MTRIERVQMPDGTFAPAREYPNDTVRVYIDANHYICYQRGDVLPPEPVLE